MREAAGPIAPAPTSCRSLRRSILIASPRNFRPLRLRYLTGAGGKTGQWGAPSSSLRAKGRDDPVKKTDQVVRHVIDMRRITPLQLPALAKHLAGALRDDQHRDHPEYMGVARLRARSSNIALLRGSTRWRARKRS